LNNIEIVNDQDKVKNLRKIKQIENILNERMINLQDLKSLAWNGIPFG